MLKILMVHSFYRQRGGEDECFEAEASLLESGGESVVRYTARNERLLEMSAARRLAATLWNQSVADEVRSLVRRERPALVHFQNTFPLVSPAAIRAASEAGVPVVKALRNYRLLCANALFQRSGGPCEACVGRFAQWPGVAHGCYRGSRVASAAVAAMTSLHWKLGTWADHVDLFVTPTQFARSRFVAGGIPPERIAVKPDFVHPDPGAGSGEGGYALFVGRLTKEKGIETLLAAWERLGGTRRLRVVGDGPLAPWVARRAEETPRIEYLGPMPLLEVYGLMRDAAVQVVPSTWYETFGRIVAEAFACGTPVIASRIGALAELVDEGRTGFLFAAGSVEDLAEKLEGFFSNRHVSEMRLAARAEFERRYTARQNHRSLREIYARASAIRARRAADEAG